MLNIKSLIAAGVLSGVALASFAQATPATKPAAAATPAVTAAAPAATPVAAATPAKTETAPATKTKKVKHHKAKKAAEAKPM